MLLTTGLVIPKGVWHPRKINDTQDGGDPWGGLQWEDRTVHYSLPNFQNFELSPTSLIFSFPRINNPNWFNLPMEYFREKHSIITPNKSNNTHNCLFQPTPSPGHFLSLMIIAHLTDTTSVKGEAEIELTRTVSTGWHGMLLQPEMGGWWVKWKKLNAPKWDMMFILSISFSKNNCVLLVGEPIVKNISLTKDKQ